MQEEASGLRQNAHQNQHCRHHFNRRAKVGLFQVLVIQQRHQQQHTRVGVAGAEVGLLEWRQVTPSEYTKERVTAIHHRGKCEPGDDREHTKAVHDLLVLSFTTLLQATDQLRVEMPETSSSIPCC